MTARRRQAEDGLGDRGTAGSAFAAAAGYRHALARVFARADAGDPLDPAGPWPTVLWVMLNPSTADATRDDPTIRRVCAFALREDVVAAAGGAVERAAVVNLYALRATDPRDLRRVIRASPALALGEGVDARIEAWARSARLVIVGWGAHAPAERAAAVLGRLARACPGRVHRLGPPTSGGHPRHPLYLAAGTPLQAVA